MSRKKKNNALVFYVDDTRTIARDFIRRPPFESYSAVGYGIFYKLDDKRLYPMLDKCLDQLLPGADDGNQNMLNNKLLAIGQQAMVDLKRQYIRIRDTIHRLTSRWKIDQYDMEQMLARDVETLQALMEEHQKTSEALEAYEKGVSK